MNKRRLLILSFFLFSRSAFCGFQTYYLPLEVDQLRRAKGFALKALIKKINKNHFRPLGYRSSKFLVFSSVDLQKDEQGYFLKDVYCNKKVPYEVGSSDFPNGDINVEHTWPRSKGSSMEPFKGDLHHLFPADAKANGLRGAYPFGEVSGGPIYPGCEPSKFGAIILPHQRGVSANQQGYEPPDEHKGNVARALFYASMVYDLEISNLEEHYLRKWHGEDPVDDREVRRNDAIEDSQGNRNPFIDFPKLVERVEDF